MGWEGRGGELREEGGDRAVVGLYWKQVAKQVQLASSRTWLKTHCAEHLGQTFTVCAERRSECCCSRGEMCCRSKLHHCLCEDTWFSNYVPIYTLYTVLKYKFVVLVFLFPDTLYLHCTTFIKQHIFKLIYFISSQIKRKNKTKKLF